MDTGMWEAIVGSLILLGGGGVGVLFWTHMTKAQDGAEAAFKKAHSLEVTVLEQRAIHTEEMRKAQVALLEYQLHASTFFVPKADHADVINEIFRKLENQDRQQTTNFTEIRNWLNTKFEALATQISNKQDRSPH